MPLRSLTYFTMHSISPHFPHRKHDEYVQCSLRSDIAPDRQVGIVNEVSERTTRLSGG